jgi:hypothetical protein
MSSSTSTPIIEIQFMLEDSNITNQNPSITKELSSTQPYEVNKISEDAATSNESFKYSGRHDHGSNAQLKEGGYYAAMLTALNEAKEESNEVLSAEMDRQKELGEGGQKKKSRVNEADAYA